MAVVCHCWHNVQSDYRHLFISSDIHLLRTASLDSWCYGQCLKKFSSWWCQTLWKIIIRQLGWWNISNVWKFIIQSCSRKTTNQFCSSPAPLRPRHGRGVLPQHLKAIEPRPGGAAVSLLQYPKTMGKPWENGGLASGNDWLLQSYEISHGPGDMVWVFPLKTVIFHRKL